jgi:hypothetical protein
MRTMIALLLLTTAAMAKDERMECSGTVVDAPNHARNQDPDHWIYFDSGSKCVIGWDGAGHDPIKPCAVGEECKITGIWSHREGSKIWRLKQFIHIQRIEEQK